MFDQREPNAKQAVRREPPAGDLSQLHKQYPSLYDGHIIVAVLMCKGGSIRSALHSCCIAQRLLLDGRSANETLMSSDLDEVVSTAFLVI